MSALEGALRAAAAASGVELDDRIVAACGAHHQLLVTWNRTHNLTRVTEPAEAARVHYLDCLLPLLDWEAPPSVVDVGSGAGFPGLLAGLVWPTARLTLVEPAKKRASFLILAAAAMGVQMEVADPGGPARGARVLSRATFSPGARRALCDSAEPGGEIVVWGHHHDTATWRDEVSTWGWRVLPPRPYRVAGLEERCLLRATQL